MDIGTGLASMGDSIADAMQQYHKQHVAYDQAASVADALSRIGINDQGVLTPLVGADGKPIQGVHQVLDQKAVDLFKTNASDKRAQAQGALQALSRIGLTTASRLISQAGSQPVVQARTDLMRARTANVGQRTLKTQIDIAQQLGLIPKVAPPPTGGQIRNYQIGQQKLAIAQQTKLEKQLAAQNINDPSSLLDAQNWQYGTMQKGAINRYTGGIAGSAQPSFVPNADPNDYVRIPGVRNPIPVNQALSLQKKAVQWQGYAKAAEQKPIDINAPDQSIQRLLANPTPQMKAMFDQVHGAGAADIVINAQGVKDPNAQPTPAPTPEPPEDTSGEEPAPNENE
jgi:hypothetical protein